MQYTAIYVRQSADRADSVSLETQEALCRRDLTEYEEARVFSDRGFSGKNTDRPALQQMLSEIRTGQISRVLVYKLDRISRNLADFTSLLTLFQAQGTAFSSHTERFETGTPMGQAMQSLLMVFAQLERETISGRVRDAAFSRAKMGFDTGGAAPFGFRREPALLHGKRTHILVPDEHADAVREAFAQYLQAETSLCTLAGSWNRAGIHTARGGRWSSATVGRVLRNPVYVQADAAVYAFLSSRGAEICAGEQLPQGHGVTLYADRRVNHSRFTDLHGVLAVPAAHRGLIGAETWLMCQQKLTASNRQRTRGKGANTWLSGILFCARCGSAMTAVRGRSQMYLVCSGKKRGICEGAGAVWRVQEAESLIGRAIAERLSQLAEYPFSAKSPGTHAETEALRLRREKLLRALTDSDDAAAAELAEAAARLTARIKALEERTARQVTGAIPLPDWQTCDFSARKTVAQILFRGIWAEGSTLHAVLK